MSETETLDGAAENQLRLLAESAYAASAAREGIAQAVLRRSKRARRRRAVVGSSIVGVALLGSVAAVTVGGGPYYEFRQPSAIMEPAVPVGSSVVVNRDLVPQRLDVVQLVLDHDGQEVDGLLRVVGVAGDVVACPADPIGSCNLTVDGAPVGDAYVDELAGDPFEELVVPEGRLFVLGDSRRTAVDSRLLGPVDLDDVLGVAVAVTTRDGTTSRVAGAPPHAVPDDYEVDVELPVPPASVEPVE